MKIPETMIELAASEEQSRYTLNGVQLDTEKKVLVASDGHILAVVPAEVSTEDHSGVIPVAAFKAARKLGKEKRNKAADNAVSISCNGAVTVSDGVATEKHDYIPGPFPNWQASVDHAPKPEGKPTIRLDAELLLRLAKAITKKTRNDQYVVDLWIADRDHAVYVGGDDEAYGLIMPVRVK